MAALLDDLRAGVEDAHRGGRSFRLADGRTARLHTFYDLAAGRALALVWLLDGAAADAAIKVVLVEHVV